MGLESGWNCHISLLSEGARYHALELDVSLSMSLELFMGHIRDFLLIVDASNPTLLTLLIPLRDSFLRKNFKENFERKKIRGRRFKKKVFSTERI